MNHKNDALRPYGALTILCAMGLPAVIFCAAVSWHFKRQMMLDYQAAQKKFYMATASYLAVNNDAHIVREYFPIVAGLKKLGVFERELRLEWVEFLQQAGTRLGLPSLQYRIGAQAEYQPSPPVNYDGYRIYYRTMHIEIDLVHEGDMQAFFTELDQRTLGIYNIASCSLSRLQKEITYELNRGNIHTECELLWFNIRKLNGGDPNLS